MIYGGRFDPDIKEKRIKELEEIMQESTFWDDKQNSGKVISELNELTNTTKKTKALKEEITFHSEALSVAKENSDEYIWALEEYSRLEKELEELEILVLLNKPYDSHDAILEIHSGAGGTEACDWANMLYRMYTRWCEKKGYKIEVLDEQEGLEVGIKSVSLIIKGINAYGYLKSEKGIHRLVRISPFDSNARRHTSFASVEITPVIDNEINIEIDEKDLKIDVYRSAGAGGQSVNTTDSAVRVTHLPTKIVVTCQNERSQMQNKETCLKILKSKLYELEVENKKEEMKELKGEQKGIDFGSQIRSYVMCPYTLVKDHRTNAEDVNVNKVLDGDIDIFIQSCLKEN